MAPPTKADARRAAPPTSTRAAQRDARRAQILDTATRAFGETGYRGTSLRDLARACGISHPTLLHHFPTKDDLLLAVLQRRDERTVLELGELTGPRDVPGFLLRMTEVNATMPGIIALFTVTAAEATAPDHPAHAYYRDRYRLALTHLAGMLGQARAEGLLRPGVDPERAAQTVFALQDGSQVQWLLDPAGTDLRALVADQVRTLFVEEAWPAELRED